MNIEMLEKTDWIIFKAMVGSHAYGTSVPTSDMDYRGIFVMPLEKRVSIMQQLQEVGQEKPEDIKYYEIEKFIRLAKDCNPNIIEFLFMPEDCIKVCDARMRKLLDNRKLFVSKKAYHTFCGYAYAQIKKAKGENKWVNNPKPKEPPKREDFCWLIPRAHFQDHPTPARPILVSQLGMDLAEYHVSSLEHVSDTYRLYWYGKEAKGVFRGGNLACESIPLGDEQSHFSGLLIYNDHEYQRAMQDHKNYWTWVKERNQNRWVSQEKGEVDYDCKNMQHCVRLLISGAAILKTGEPIIRFDGEQLQYLRDIRAGHFTHEQLMADVDRRMAEMDALKDTSALPWAADEAGIDALYREIVM